MRVEGGSVKIGPLSVPAGDYTLYVYISIFYVMIRRPHRSTQRRSSAASDVYKRQAKHRFVLKKVFEIDVQQNLLVQKGILSLIHISEPTRLGMISYAVFCLKKK